MTKIEFIIETSWEHLQDLRGDDNQIFLSDLNSNTLTWLEGQPISNRDALTLLEQWVRESMEKHGKVLLYTCRDNSEISIEDLKYQEEEDLLIYEKFDPGIPLYIGYD